MGKHKNSKDKIYKTVGELASKHLGSSQNPELASIQKIKFDTCCLTLGPVINKHVGLCDDEDSFCYVFECDYIVRFLEKFKVHPISGRKISGKSSLIELRFHKNDRGFYHCPILFKLFNQHSKIIAYKKSGHVVSYEAFYQLNLKTNNFKDPLTDEPFCKTDVVTIQDPELCHSKWDVNSFYYVRKNLKVDDGLENNNIRKVDETSVLSAVLEEYNSKAEATATNFKKILGDAVVLTPDSKRLDQFNSALYSDGLLANSVTSTVMPIQSKIAAAELSEEQIIYPRVKKKGYVQIVTNFGHLNLELFCNRVPKTCHNFMILASKGYYDNTTFHRLVKNFILQGGDPTGTGLGGKSAWDLPFKDECHKDLSHSERGLLAMANSGPNTNRSQFYITLRSNNSHLDGKHTVFGKIVGGEDTLKRIESVEVDKKDRPKQKIEIVKVNVFIDPFQDIQKMIEEERSKRDLGSESVNSKQGPPSKKFRTEVGVFVDLNLVKKDHNVDSRVNSHRIEMTTDNIRNTMVEKLALMKPKVRKPSKTFGNFSAW